jgi:hypothetical protein
LRARLARADGGSHLCTAVIERRSGAREIADHGSLLEAEELAGFILGTASPASHGKSHRTGSRPPRLINSQPRRNQGGAACPEDTDVRFTHRRREPAGRCAHSLRFRAAPRAPRPRRLPRCWAADLGWAGVVSSGFAVIGSSSSRGGDCGSVCQARRGAPACAVEAQVEVGSEQRAAGHCNRRTRAGLVSAAPGAGSGGGRAASDGRRGW